MTSERDKFPSDDEFLFFSADSAREIYRRSGTRYGEKFKAVSNDVLTHIWRASHTSQEYRYRAGNPDELTVMVSDDLKSRGFSVELSRNPDSGFFDMLISWK